MSLRENETRSLLVVVFPELYYKQKLWVSLGTSALQTSMGIPNTFQIPDSGDKGRWKRVYGATVGTLLKTYSDREGT